MGYSSSGKTLFITTAIKLLRKKWNYNISVIKNVNHHPVDKKGKDSSRFKEAGAIYSVIQNNNNETAIFITLDDDKLIQLIEWLDLGPYKTDLIFTEGFRNLKNPTVLCVSNLDEIEQQLTENVKMISGVICSSETVKKNVFNIPIIDIKNQFLTFLNLFDIPPKRS